MCNLSSFFSFMISEAAQGVIDACPHDPRAQMMINGAVLSAGSLQLLKMSQISSTIRSLVSRDDDALPRLKPIQMMARLGAAAVGVAGLCIGAYCTVMGAGEYVQESYLYSTTSLSSKSLAEPSENGNALRIDEQTEVGLDKEGQFEPQPNRAASYPTISQMSPRELEEFPISPTWMDQRFLFQETAKKSRAHNSAMALGYSAAYSQGYPEKHFRKVFEDLDKEDIYLDIGAGQAVAIREYLESYPNRSKVIGISNTRSYQKNTDELIELEKAASDLRYYLCDFPNCPPLDLLKGRVSVITDIFASCRYTFELKDVIYRMGELLKPGGKAFITVGSDGPKILAQGLVHENALCSDCKELNVGYKELTTLWFHTMKGFKVSSSDNLGSAANALETDPETILHDSKHDHFILERTSEPIVIEELIHQPEDALQYQPILTNTKYIWQPSEEVRTWIEKITKLNQ